MGSFAVLLVLAVSISVAWAYPVFRVFNGADCDRGELIRGFRRHALKGLGTALFSCGIGALAIFGLYFYLFRMPGPDLGRYLLAGTLLGFSILWASVNLYVWPLLFFQSPPFHKIYQRAFLLTLAQGPRTLGLLVFFAAMILLFTVAPVLWAFVGIVAVFSLQCVALEKQLLRYRITYEDRPLGEFLEALDREKNRGWRDFLKPWEHR